MKYFKEIKDDFEIKELEVNRYLIWLGKFGKILEKYLEKIYNY